MAALDITVIGVGFHAYEFGAGGLEQVGPAPADGGLMKDFSEHASYGDRSGVAFEEGGEDVSACGASLCGCNCGGERKEGQVEGMFEEGRAVVAVGDQVAWGNREICVCDCSWLLDSEGGALRYGNKEMECCGDDTMHAEYGHRC